MKRFWPNQLTATRLAILGGLVMVASACANGSGAGAPGSSASTSATETAAASGSQQPETGTTSGDVPDNAVFLTYRDAALGYAIQYVEGWQVTAGADGVTIRDKDSSEIVKVAAAQTDVAGFVSRTDLPALHQQTGFNLVKQETVTVRGQGLIHLIYEVPSPADPVTGKQVPSTVDRYYVPGPHGLAIVSLSTPTGVDNVDAFRQMIGSFRWG